MPSASWVQQQLQGVGPVIAVSLGLVDAAEKALIASGGTVPPPVSILMMIDTGASASSIAPGLAGQLELQQVGVVQILTPQTTGAPVTLPTYPAKLTLPTGAVYETTVAETPLAGQAIQGLLGRDVLSQCVLIYVGFTNQFMLST